MKYQVRFFGIPDIFTDGERCVFPFRKAQALALMLAEEKSVSKSRICEYLWPDKAPEKARRNLSNALSCVKKILPAKVDGDIVSLDPNIKIERDTDLILRLDSLGWQEITTLCRPYIDVGEMCDWPYFSDWLISKRQYYGRLIVKNLKKRAQARLAGYAKNGAEDALLCYEKLAELEPYDEKIHAELVRLYIKTNQKARAIDAAHAFSSRMENDFGIEADLSEVSSLMKRKKEAPGAGASLPADESSPLARKSEILKMLDFFCGAKESQSLCGLVWGEQGIGKTAFVGEVSAGLKQKGWECFSVNCLQEEKAYPLAPITRLLKQLQIPGDWQANINSHSEYSYSYLADILRQSVAGRPEGARRLLMIENIQWMDDASWNIVESIMGDNSAPCNMLITGFEEARPAFMLRAALADEPFEKFEITLRRFNLEETARICAEISPDEDWSDERVHEIYMQTEGNPFFIKEMLRHRHDGIIRGKQPYKNIYLSMIELLSEEERLFLEAAAVSPECASMTETAAVLGVTPLDVSKYYSALRLHGFLRESESGGDVFYYFTHAKIREALLFGMTLSRKKALHLKYIELLEASLPKTLRYRHRKLCKRLAYHCGEAGLPLKELYWRVRELELHFAAAHEVFPALVDQDLMHYIPTVEDVSYTQKALGEAWEKMDALFRTEGGSPELLRIERDLYILKGGCLWWSGRSADADIMLRGAVRRAVSAGEAEPIIKAGVQMCYLAIQRDDAKKLMFCARKLLDFARRNSFRQWEGTALRFMAIAEILAGRHAEAEKHLLLSASVFEKLEEKGENYTASLIAAEHFRGDAMLAAGRVPEALAFYENCIKIGDSVALFRGLGLSLAKAAFCLILLERYDEAEKYLQRVGRFCGIMHTDWDEGLQGGGFAYSLTGLLKCRKKDWYHGAICFAVAERLVNEAQRPVWGAVLCWSKLRLYTIAPDMPKDFAEKVLKHPKEWYETQLERLKSRVGWI